LLEESAGLIKIPFPEPGPRSDARLRLSFGPPAVTNVTGSFIHRNGLRYDEPMVVDMVVTMPNVNPLPVPDVSPLAADIGCRVFLSKRTI
jgi:hypothetical protein